MKRYKESFTEDELKQALHANDDAAKELLEDSDKWASFKEKIDDFLHRSNKIPVLRSIIDDLASMVQIIDAYVKREYTDIPWTTLLSIVGALIYVLSPIDLIPDFIPVIGYFDDAAVVLLVLNLGAGHDLEKFKAWQEEKRQQVIADLEKMTGQAIQELLEDNMLGALILSSDNKLRVLAVEPTDTDEPPYDCKVLFLSMPVDILRAMYLDKEEELLDFLRGVTDYEGFVWSPIGKLEPIHEANFEKYEDYFSIMEEEDKIERDC